MHAVHFIAESGKRAHTHERGLAGTYFADEENLHLLVTERMSSDMWAL